MSTVNKPSRVEYLRSRPEDFQSILPFLLFDCHEVSILTCKLLDSTPEKEPSAGDTVTQEKDMALRTCVDNIIFRLGNEVIGSLEIFLDPYLEYLFAVGNSVQVEQLRQDIVGSFHFEPPRDNGRAVGSSSNS